MFVLELSVSEDQLKELNVETNDQRPKSTVVVVPYLPSLCSVMTSEDRSQRSQRSADSEDQVRRNACAEQECREIADLNKRRSAQLVKTEETWFKQKKTWKILNGKKQSRWIVIDMTANDIEDLEGIDEAEITVNEERKYQKLMATFQ